MPKTTILEPLTNDEKQQHKSSELLKHHNTIFTKLQNMDLRNAISFSNFLQNISMDFKTYTMAIRYKLKRPTLFLERTPQNIRTNPFARQLAPLWNANMDAQFILDAYSKLLYFLSD